MVISGSTPVQYMPSYPNTNIIRLAWTGEIKNLTHFLKNKKVRNITVNAISPGPILTPLHREHIMRSADQNGRSFEEEMNNKASSILRGKYGDVEDVANSVSFLLSTKSSHINGTNIILDGGESRSY